MKLTLSQQIKLNKLLAYSDRYQITIEFWEGEVEIYAIRALKDSYEGRGSFDNAVDGALTYLKRINREE